MKFSEIVSLLNGKKGLEFGGPTLLFENHGELPLYSHVNLDAGNIFEDNYFLFYLIDKYRVFNFFLKID